VPEVFVTGLGVLSSRGVGVAPLAEGLRGCSHRLPELVGTPLETQEVGFVPGLEEAAKSLPPKVRKFMSEAALLGCLAGREAWQQAGLEGRVAPERIGIYAASGLTAANFEAASDMLGHCVGPEGEFSAELLGAAGLARMNPLDSFRILPNMPPCILAMLLGIRGPSLVFNPFEDQGAAALIEAMQAIAGGEVEAALTGASDTPSAPSTLVYLRQKGLLAEGEIPSPAAVYLVLEPLPGRSPLARLHLNPGGEAWRDACAPELGRTFAVAPALALAQALVSGEAQVVLPGATLRVERLP